MRYTFHSSAFATRIRPSVALPVCQTYLPLHRATKYDEHGQTINASYVTAQYDAIVQQMHQ